MNVRSLFTVQRNLALFVSTSILLVLWLSISFWVQAYVEREDAKKIQRDSVQENQLFGLSTHLSGQRSLIHRLLNEQPVLPESIARFNNSLSITDTKIQLIQKSFIENTNTSSNTSSNRTLATIQTRLDQIVLHQNALKELKTKLEQQMHLPKHQRDSDFRMSLFHKYNDFIDEVGELRLSVHFVPRFTNQDILYYSQLSNSAWYLNESTRQIDSLLEGMILDTLDTTAHNNAQHADMINASNIRADIALKALVRQRQKRDSNSPIEAQVDEVIELYNQRYKQFSQKHLMSLMGNSIDINSLEMWREETKKLKLQVELLGFLAKPSFIDKVKTAEKTALRNMIIDSFLVLLCIAMATASLIYFKKVHKQAHHDELTGLPNRRMFSLIFNQMMDEASASKDPIWLLTIDLDRFKAINDSMGHAVGDKLLKQVADRLNKIASGATVARMGGDEFIVLSSTSDASDAEALAAKLHNCLNQPFLIDGGMLHIGGSVGVCGYPDDVDTAKELLAASDLAMYNAKNSGRNLVVRFEPSMASEYELRLSTERELQFAVMRDQFELHFQPQFNCVIEEVDSVEALIRWNHPERGQVSPYDFIPIAEECGFITQIGDWVLDEACRHAAQWAHVDKIPLRVAVNVSTEQFLETDFVDKVLACLEKHQLDAKYLELEVTESVVMADIDTVVAALKQLRSVGIKIALDDFGTGYSSLSYLQNLPLDTLKIDKSFVQKLQSGSTEIESITQTIAHLANTLGMDTVAEGVETQDQLSQISAIGIDVIQGYMYSKPVPALDIISVINGINNSKSDGADAA